jgi:hypothetical protein
MDRGLLGYTPGSDDLTARPGTLALLPATLPLRISPTLSEREGFLWTPGVAPGRPGGVRDALRGEWTG